MLRVPTIAKVDELDEQAERQQNFWHGGEWAPPPSSPRVTKQQSSFGRSETSEWRLSTATAPQKLLLSVELCALCNLGQAHPPIAAADLVNLLLEAGHAKPEADGCRARARWQASLKPAIALGRQDDPWIEHQVHKCATELAVRYDYDPSSDQWLRSTTFVKMEKSPFANGAMRECYRMKKMSQVSSSFFFRMDWVHCHNYVAKRYIKADTPSATYFDDIKMQMVSKHYADLYNHRSPPKPVDFLQAFVMEIVRDGTTVHFCIERAIETERYVKHSNNAGGVIDPDGVHRATPHVFSRFSFYASKGSLMVVDIRTPPSRRLLD